MANRNFDIVKKDSQIRERTFKYSKGKVNLAFTLRTDIKQDLKDFLELLKVGITEVEEELANK